MFAVCTSSETWFIRNDYCFADCFYSAAFKLKTKTKNKNKPGRRKVVSHLQESKGEKLGEGPSLSVLRENMASSPGLQPT